MNKSYKKAFKILNIFKKNNIESFIVGGAVRDFLLKREPQDIDITTSAFPGKVMKLFTAKPTGLKYGSVTILFEDETFEVTTYRIEENYNDYRHPDSVIYTDDVSQDVWRRDFTINALLLAVNGDIVDHVGGKKDLESKIIRAIGNPDERFLEDALRILRACYFESKLDFTIEEQTRASMAKNAHLLGTLPSERITQELIKILYEPETLKAFKTMVETNIIAYLPFVGKAIEYFISIEEKPFVDTFWAVSYCLNQKADTFYNLTNKDKHKYQKVLELYLNKTKINDFTLYTYGLDISILYDKVNYYLKEPSLNKNMILKMYENLPIKSQADLKVSSRKLIELSGKKQGAWLGLLLEELALGVLKKEIQNDESDLLKHAFLSKHFK